MFRERYILALQWSVLRLWLFLDCKIVWPISVLLLVKKLTDFNTVKKSHVLISYDLPLKIWWTWVIPLVSTHRQQYITMEWNCRNNRLFRPFCMMFFFFSWCSCSLFCWPLPAVSCIYKTLEHLWCPNIVSIWSNGPIKLMFQICQIVFSFPYNRQKHPFFDRTLDPTKYTSIGTFTLMHLNQTDAPKYVRRTPNNIHTHRYIAITWS